MTLSGLNGITRMSLNGIDQFLSDIMEAGIIMYQNFTTDRKFINYKENIDYTNL